MLIVLWLIMVVGGQCLMAKLDFLSVDPATFQLSFSANITLPKFQLLLNNHNIQYSIVSTSNYSDSFLIESSEKPNHSIQIEVYTIRFNEPLNVGDGTLNLDNFVLRTELPHIDISSLSWLAVVMSIVMYSAIMVDLGGLWLVEFIQVYIILQSNAQYWSLFDKQMAEYLLITLTQSSFVVNKQFNQFRQIMIMLLPIILIGASGLIGLLLRRFFHPQQYLGKAIKQFFTFRLFITIGLIFTFSLISNGLNFSDHNKLFDSFYYKIGGFISYFGMAVTFSFVLFGVAVINPRFKQGDKQIRQHQNTQSYCLFSKFYGGLVMQNWQKRNLHLIILFKKLIATLIGSKYHNFYGIFVLLQVAHLFYIFTVRPYKYTFYVYTSIIIQSLIVFFYFYIFETMLYFQIGTQIITHQEVLDYIIRRTIIFSIIVLLLIPITIYEFYQRMIAFKQGLQERKPNANKITYGEELKDMSSRIKNKDEQTKSITKSNKWNQRSLFDEILDK